jgi:hypothetical protein
VQIRDDAIGWARAAPWNFFPGGDATPTRLLAWVMDDVITLGGGDCVIRHTGGWYAIGSDRDWLAHDEHRPRDLFTRVVSHPERRVHDLRAELLLAAFATSVWISLDGARDEIQGAAPPDEAWALTAGLHRAILFAM